MGAGLQISMQHDSSYIGGYVKYKIYMYLYKPVCPRITIP